MRRGIRLEEDVFCVIEKKYGPLQKCGLRLDSSYPEMGASADAIGENHTFEIKCPTTKENIDYYIDGKLYKVTRKLDC